MLSAESSDLLETAVQEFDGRDDDGLSDVRHEQATKTTNANTAKNGT